MTAPAAHTAIPSIDALLQRADITGLVAEHGRPLVVEALREAAAAIRAGAAGQSLDRAAAAQAIAGDAGGRLAARLAPTLRRVYNLTGTVLHTNLGRAPLPDEAIAAMRDAAGAVSVEMDLASGRRGERDDHVAGWLCRLTGAEAATVVNNNAAAVLLVLNSLALRKEVPVSRGELIEIGGAFRLPDIMSRAGCKLIEVGTTNRTHPRDFERAIGKRTAVLMKVHTSNYVVQGFTAAVSGHDLAGIAHAADLPMVEDLGSGSLADLSRLGLPHEPTAAESIAAGADVVTFSGDKLLGGPQCGIVVGRADLIARIRKNPLKRALRLDKITLAALGAVLPLHANPDALAARVPALRLLSRRHDDLRAAAERLAPALRAALGADATVTVEDCASQVGSGALPLVRLPSAAMVVDPAGASRGRGRAARRLLDRLRALPVPVIGRIRDDRVFLDVRCLEDEDGFVRQLDAGPGSQR